MKKNNMKSQIQNVYSPYYTGASTVRSSSRRSGNFNPPGYIGTFGTDIRHISRIEIFAQRGDRSKWSVLKLALSDAGPDCGFTLLELLVVIALLSTMAWMTLGLVGNRTDQVHFDDTRNRLQAIRRAVIGDTSRTLNGHPEIRGYVADMGELPANLNALISKEYCPNHPEIDNAADCTAAGETWVSQPGYGYDSVHGIWAGWNGPYLNAAEMTGYPKFLDGWGNDDGSDDFGWNVTVADDLKIQSYGLDGASGGSDYAQDYPPAGSDTLVAENEYTVVVTDEGPTTTPGTGDGSGGLWVDFGTPNSCWACADGGADSGLIGNRKDCEGAGYSWAPVYGRTDRTACEAEDVDSDTDLDGIWLPFSRPEEDICLVVAQRSLGIVTNLASIGDEYNTSTDPTFTWDGSHQKIQFLFPDSTYLTQGQLAYGFFEFEDNGNSDPSDDVCDATKPFPADSSWRLLSIVPGSVTQPLGWDVE